MSSQSNLYAEKVFSEHPIGLWSFDDPVHYISYISESKRTIQTITSPQWSITNGSVASLQTISNTPFEDSASSRVEGSVPAGSTETMTVLSPNIINAQDLNQDQETFTVGTYVYVHTPFLLSISIGYKYQDPDTLTDVTNLKTFDTSVFGKWLFISETFEIPNVNAQIKIVFQATYSSGGAAQSDYAFTFNGISFGQWCEEFNTYNIGSDIASLPADISLENVDYVIEADAYGLEVNPAYYIASSNELFAKNTSVPMVFGAPGITKLIPNPNGPSLIIPGEGALNNKGKFNEYTIEFWARINCDSNTPKRIFGPIASDDGIYVENGFLILKIGSNFISHFISEWYRPMLIDIKILRNNASLLINGEEVGSLSFITNDLSFPDELDVNDKSQNWLGFYAYDEVSPIEIDAVAIYSYPVSEVVAKRRFVYGQGVSSPELIDAGYGGSTTLIDYSFAEYTANYNYPNFANWSQGSFDNLTSDNKTLKTPDYSLPSIYLNSGTESNLFADCYDIQGTSSNFFTFRPNSSWNSSDGYLYFPRLNTINGSINAFWGIFKVDTIDPDEQILMYIKNKNNQDYFKISIEGNDIRYYVNVDEIAYEIIESVDGTIDGGLYETVIFETTLDAEYYNTEYTDEISGGSFTDVETSLPFVVGIKIDQLIEAYGYRVAKFFGDIANLELYVGGNKDLDKTFTGKILSVGISNIPNSDGFATGFDGNGIAEIDSPGLFTNKLATYTLLPTIAYEKFYLDIGISGYWEDYMPLSYFGQYIKDYSGNRKYSLDFLQFNIGYPKPIQNDGILFNTDGHEIKSFVTFQTLDTGNNLLRSNFVYSESPNYSNLLDLNIYPNWESTIFEIVDGTVIYPRTDNNFNNYAIVYRVEFNVRNIINKPVTLSRLEICSQAFNKNSFNKIGTRFGNEIYPYKKSGLYFDYKEKNPYLIYKESSPYLYLTKNSGIKMIGNYQPLMDRGISIPINNFLSTNYRVSAAQMWAIFDENSFSSTPVQIFEISYSGDKILFYMVANSDSGDRAKIYAILQSTGQTYDGISYYLNGSLVREPVVSKTEWFVLGLRFATALDLDSTKGFINISGPLTYNNISYYQANNIQQLQGFIKRPWSKVLTDETLNDWQYWLDSFTWSEVLIIGSSDLYGVNPADIYDTYTGANKVVFDDNEGMTFDSDKIKMFQSILWSSSVTTPA